MPQIPSVQIHELPADALLLDVREDDEWAAGHVEGAVHVPMNQVPNAVQYAPEQLPRDKQIYVMCKVGGRSAQVTGWLNQQGFNAVNVDGGMLAWASAQRPMTGEGPDHPFVL